MADRGHRGILVGYDGSAHAGAAVDWAAAEAARRGVPLRVLTAAGYSAMGPGAVPASPWVPQRATAAAYSVAEDGADRARKNASHVLVEATTMPETVARALLTASRDADLVVVGNRGHGGLLGAVLGSVAFTVTAHAACPVVVVRGDGTTTAGPQHPVVVGVDGSPGSQAALSFAADHAAATGAPLHVVSAWLVSASDAWALAYAPPAADEVAGSSERAAQDVVEAAAASVATWHPGLAVIREVVAGAPAAALTHPSRAAGLVVVGARGRGGFAGLLLGSVSHGVIHAGTCPVAVLRHH